MKAFINFLKLLLMNFIHQHKTSMTFLSGEFICVSQLPPSCFYANRFVDSPHDGNAKECNVVNDRPV